MNILVLNCGSSSLKFQLIATDLERIERDEDRRLAHGQIERIGGAAIIIFTAEGKPTHRSAAPIKDMRSAVETVLRWIASDASEINEIKALADIQAANRQLSRTKFCGASKIVSNSRHFMTPPIAKEF